MQNQNNVQGKERCFIKLNFISTKCFAATRYSEFVACFNYTHLRDVISPRRHDRARVFFQLTIKTPGIARCNCFKIKEFIHEQEVVRNSNIPWKRTEKIITRILRITFFVVAALNGVMVIVDSLFMYNWKVKRVPVTRYDINNSVYLSALKSFKVFRLARIFCSCFRCTKLPTKMK